MVERITIDEEPTFENVLAAMIQHSKDNPTHGTNCACKDDLLRRLKYDNLMRFKGEEYFSTNLGYVLSVLNNAHWRIF